MANPELGAKQICPNCQTKFYDLTKRPAHCPKCDLEFDPEEALKARRGVRGRPVPNYDDDKPADKPVRDEDAEDLEDEEEEVEATPEIDAAASEPDPNATDEDDDAAPEPDTGVSEDLADEEDEAEAESDDVPFLEDDEESFDDEDIEGVPGEGEEGEER